MSSPRSLAIAIAAFAIFTQTGCATILLGGSAYRPRTAHTLIHEDSVVAIGRGVLPDNPKESRGLVIVGLKNSYLLTRGADEIAAIASSLDGNFVRVNYRDELNFDFTHDHDLVLIASSDGFYGVIEIGYLNDSNVYSPSELANLKRLGFNREEIPAFLYGTKTIFRKQISLKGSIYQLPASLGELQSKFKTERRIKIYSEHQENSLDLETVTFLPLAIMFDVATFPLQALLLGMESTE